LRRPGKNCSFSVRESFHKRLILQHFRTPRRLSMAQFLPAEERHPRVLAPGGAA